MRERTTGTAMGPRRLLEAGDEGAPRVVLLHGFPDVPEGWAPVMRELAARGRHAIAPWMPGFTPPGAAAEAGPFDADALADHVAALLEALKQPVGPIDLVGHDWGSAVAHQVLIRHPHLVRRAITMSVPHPITFLKFTATHPAQLARSAYMAFFQLPYLPERALSARGFAPLRALWRRWSPGFEPPPSYWAALEGTLARSMEGPLGYYRAMFRPFGAAATRIGHAQRAKIPHDVLYLHGARDGCITPDARHGQAAHFSGRFEEHVMDAGHFLQLERPRETATLIDEWLAR